MKKIILSIMLAIILIVPNAMAESFDQLWSFEDDFNRANSNTVGNGWNEGGVYADGERIAGNALYLDEVGASYGARVWHSDSNLNSLWQLYYTYSYSISSGHEQVYAQVEASTYWNSGYNFFDDTNQNVRQGSTVLDYESDNGLNSGKVRLQRMSDDLRVRYWASGSDEPTDWDLSGTIVSEINGDLYFSASMNGGQQFDVTIDNVKLIGQNTTGVAFLTYDSTGDGVIYNVTANLYDENGTLLLSELAEEGGQFYDLTSGLNYTIDLNKSGYITSNQTINYDGSSEGLEFEMVKVPAINISVFDESDGSSITQNVSIYFSSINYTFEASTITGNYYNEELLPGNYTITFSAENYTNRQYTVALAANTYRDLNAYLVDDQSPNTVLTFKDKNNGAELESVGVTIESFIDGSYQTVAAMNSDITGKVQFDYIAGREYRFTCLKEGYETKIFSLTPIIFDEYTVNLDRSTDQPAEGDYSGISIILSPEKYFSGINNTVSLSFSSPTGLFTNFGYNASFGLTSIAGSSSNAYGATLSDDLEIINATFGDVVTLFYYYDLSNGVSKNFTLNYLIVSNQSGQGTWGDTLDNEDDPYDLGILERLAIVIGITVVVAGFVTLFAGAEAGTVTALFIWGYFIWADFIDFWYFATSVIVAVVILMWRSTR